LKASSLNSIEYGIASPILFLDDIKPLVNTTVLSTNLTINILFSLYRGWLNVKREVIIEEFSGIKLRIYIYGTGSPSILITAGIHGDEVTGVYAAYKLIEYLDKTGKLNGSIKVVPVVNVPGFQARIRHNPIDHVDLNRVFPDGMGSTVTKGIIKTVWEIALSSDYVLDLHCAGHFSYPYILSVYPDHDYVKAFVDNISWHVSIESSGQRGQLFIEASHQGIPGAIIETVGGRGYYMKKWGDALFKTILGTLNNLGIIEYEEANKVKKHYGKLHRVTSDYEGFFKPYVALGKEVDEGDILGEINGNTVESPVSGIVLGLADGVYIFKGESLARIAENKG
jgi:hypothetical protein